MKRTTDYRSGKQFDKAAQRYQEVISSGEDQGKVQALYLAMMEAHDRVREEATKALGYQAAPEKPHHQYVRNPLATMSQPLGRGVTTWS